MIVSQLYLPKTKMEDDITNYEYNPTHYRMHL